MTMPQLAKFLVGAFGYTVQSYSQDFADVPPGSPFYDFVETAYHAGLMTGYGNGYFGPNDNTDRKTIVKGTIIGSGYTLVNTPASPSFTDVPPSNSYYYYIETAYRFGIIDGYSGNTFNPDGVLTRGQLAKVLYNARFFHTYPFQGANNFEWDNTGVSGLPIPGLAIIPSGTADVVAYNYGIYHMSDEEIEYTPGNYNFIKTWYAQNPGTQAATAMVFHAFGSNGSGDCSAHGFFTNWSATYPIGSWTHTSKNACNQSGGDLSETRITLTALGWDSVRSDVPYTAAAEWYGSNGNGFYGMLTTSNYLLNPSGTGWQSKDDMGKVCYRNGAGYNGGDIMSRCP